MKTILTGLGTFGACHAVRWYLDRSSRRDEVFAGGRLQLTTVRNRNAAFGLRIPARILLGASGAALFLAWRKRRAHPLSAGLILGGGAANLTERLCSGSVYDYVQFPKAPGRLKHYVFNLADFAILAGCVGMLLGGEKE